MPLVPAMSLDSLATFTKMNELFAKQVFPRLTSPGEITLTDGRLPLLISTGGCNSSFDISRKAEQASLRF